METRSTPARIAAEVLWRALVVLAGLHVYWLLGGTWGVHAASGGAYSDVTTGLRIQSAIVAALLVAGALVVRARAGLWRAPVPPRAIRAATWALTVALALAAAVNATGATDVERLGIAPFVLALAVLALVVARAPGEARRTTPPRQAQPSH